MRHTSVGLRIGLWLLLASAGGCVQRDSEPDPEALSAGAPNGRADAMGTGPSSAASGAAGSAAQVCAMPSGAYQGVFHERSGTCGPFASEGRIPVDNNITIEKFADRDIETETVVKNCTLFLEQVVRSRTSGLVESAFQGTRLELNADATTARGMVSLQRFDGVSALCSGEYDVTLTKHSGVVGAAATGP